MDDFGQAKQTYAAAKLLLSELADRKYDDDELGWTAQDLEESLLDLKLAVVEEEAIAAVEYASECTLLMSLIFNILNNEE